MKHIITPGVKEEAELLCDVTGKPAVASLLMTFWYGSDHDLSQLKVDLSNEMGEEILNLLLTKYPQFKDKLEDVGILDRCPLCERR